jgi:hypothetical protein
MMCEQKGGAMRQFWGRGALAALALLAVVTVGSYEAGSHLGLSRPAASQAAAKGPDGPARGVTVPVGHGPGHREIGGERGPRR